MNYTKLKQILEFFKHQRLAQLGVIGIVASLIFSFSKGKQQEVPENQINMPPSSPFKHTISGIGFVEANSKNINVGSYTSGIVEKLFVKEGDVVKENDPLFQLDTRSASKQVIIDEHEIKALKHSVDSAAANFKYAQDLFERDQKLVKGVKSTSDMKKAEFDFQKALADLEEKKVRLEQAIHKKDLSQIILEKLTVHAPVDGIILKTYIRKGEYINEGNQSIILTMGNHRPLYLRVQIDENDAWRFKHGGATEPSAKAIGFLRSNSGISYPLKFVRFEPYAASKKQLSGQSTELVDTRVIEIIYEIDKNPDQLVIGQQMDTFIETTQDG